MRWGIFPGGMKTGYLRGELVDAAVRADEVDRILGTLYATVEQVFRPLLRIGFASRVVDR